MWVFTYTLDHATSFFYSFSLVSTLCAALFLRVINIHTTYYVCIYIYICIHIHIHMSIDTHISDPSLVQSTETYVHACAPCSKHSVRCGRASNDRASFPEKVAFQGLVSSCEHRLKAMSVLHVLWNISQPPS